MRQTATLIPVLLLLGAASLATAAPASEKARPSTTDVLKEAVGLLDKGRFQDAVKTFLRAQELSGGPCGPCQLGLSRAYLGLRQTDRSIEASRQAIAHLRTPNAVSQAWNQLGMALVSKGAAPDLTAAEEAFRKAVETGGELVNVSRYNLADVLWRQRQYAESEQMARAALESEPGGPAARNARIVLCQAKVDAEPPPDPLELYRETSCAPSPDPQPGEPMRVDDAEGTEKVTRPEKIFGQGPSYDTAARQDGAEGVVIVESIIDEEGCIRKLRLCRSVHPSLDRATLDTIRRWVFQPAVYKGKPVKVYYTLTVNFTIGNVPGPG